MNFNFFLSCLLTQRNQFAITLFKKVISKVLNSSMNLDVETFLEALPRAFLATEPADSLVAIVSRVIRFLTTVANLCDGRVSSLVGVSRI